MTKKIIFRADGNATTGLGHLYRLFAIVEMVKDDFDFVYVTKESSYHKVIPTTYKKHVIPESIDICQEPEYLSKAFNEKEVIIVADGYGFNSNYQKRIKQFGFKLIYIDDLSREYMYANIVINHAPNIKEIDYKKEPYTKLALGAKYATLRPLFLEAITKKRFIKTIDRAFICFGGADHTDLSLKVTNALLCFSQIKELNVILGAAYKHLEIFELAKETSKIKIYKNLNEQELIDVMYRSNFALVPSSTILYEVCAVKMPVFSGYFVDNQKNMYRECLSKKIIYGGGNFEGYSIEKFKNEILKVLELNDHNKIIKNQELFFDSKIKRRFINLFSFIEYREATVKDDKLLFEWANDRLSRANSFNSNPILWEEHKNWLNEKINDDRVVLFIAEINKNPAGFIRFETKKECAIVSVFVSEKYREKGLATEFIIDASKKYLKTHTLPIYAYIKKENIPSIISFEKANFLKFKEEIINGTKSYIYQLKKE